MDGLKDFKSAATKPVGALRGGGGALESALPTKILLLFRKTDKEKLV